MEIKYSDIVAVMDIVGSEDAQKYLDCGWILLNTASVQGGENGGDDEHPHSGAGGKLQLLPVPRLR